MRLFGLFLALLFVSTTAAADVLLEPYAGYQMQNLKTTPKSGSTDFSGDGSNLGFGARLGYQWFGGFWLAADAELATEGTFKSKTQGDLKTNRTQIWLDAGFDLPILARLWAGYALSNNLNVKYAGGEEVKFKGGNSFKLGVGFKLIPMLSLNAEYMMNKYSELSWSGGSGKVDDAYSTFDDNVIQVSVSVPLSL